MAGLVCGIDTTELLKFHRNEKHERLLVFATAVGTELGKRKGKARGEQIISEARMIGAMHGTGIGVS